MLLGDRVKLVMDREGLDKPGLRAKLSAIGKPITQQALDKLIGRPQDKTKHAPAIAKALGVSLNWLLTGTGSPDGPDTPGAWFNEPFLKKLIADLMDGARKENVGPLDLPEFLANGILLKIQEREAGEIVRVKRDAAAKKGAPA